ncbi:MAG: hypothetical protein QXS40_05485 [Candidatus Nitrosocaldus sp.]
MLAVLPTRCRLCGKMFGEKVYVTGDTVIFARRYWHPIEDANAWCDECLERLNKTAEALVGEDCLKDF